MQLKSYHAFSMAEAMAAVKRDLGANAVILHTRAFKRGGFLGLGRKTVVEVTAARAEEVRGEAELITSPRADGRQGAARRAYLKTKSLRPPNGQKKTPATPLRLADRPTTPSEQDRVRTQRLAQALAERQQREQAAAAAKIGGETSSVSIEPKPTPPVPVKPKRVVTPPPAPVATPPETPTPPAPANPQPPERTFRAVATTETEAGVQPRRFVLQPVAESTETPSTSAPDAPSASPVPSTLSDAPARPSESAPVVDSEVMQAELSAIREMVGQVLQRQVGRPERTTPAMSEKVFDLYLRMTAQDLSEELANRIASDVEEELKGEPLENETAVRDAVLKRLAAYVPVAEPPVLSTSPDGRPLTIALIGPTGVGKTTTLAKLAASFKLRHDRRVGLITCDTYRIAAVDQLRTYANIIGLPLQVVLTPGEMQQAIHSLSECDVILIDTAGRSQNDTSRLDELKRFISTADPHEVHLVLSSTASEKVLLREAEAFAEVRADKIVFTKLDEAVSFGMLINVMRHVGKSLSFVTTGQEVPDHIELGRPDRLADLVLGGEVTV